MKMSKAADESGDHTVTDPATASKAPNTIFTLTRNQEKAHSYGHCTA